MNTFVFVGSSVRGFLCSWDRGFLCLWVRGCIGVDGLNVDDCMTSIRTCAFFGSCIGGTRAHTCGARAGQYPERDWTKADAVRIMEAHFAKWLQEQVWWKSQ